MNDAETPQAKQSSQWIVAATCAALVLLVTAGGMFAMRDRLLAEARMEAEAQTAAREKLSARIDALKTSLDTLANAPKADEALQTALEEKITTLNTNFESLASRQDALEKKLEEMKPVAVPAPAANAPTPPTNTPTLPATTTPDTALSELKLVALNGKPFAVELEAWMKAHPEKAAHAISLQSIAEKGIPSEADLAKRLRDTLDSLSSTTPKTEDTSLIGKINTHMNGLVSIKKAAADPYAELRKTSLSAPLDNLVQQVENLKSEHRLPLERWLSDARSRAQAIATLDALTGSGN